MEGLAFYDQKMTRPKIYGSIVKNLPIGNKSKNFLLRHWILSLYLLIGITVAISVTLNVASITPDKNFFDIFIETWWLFIITIIAWPMFLGGLGIY